MKDKAIKDIINELDSVSSREQLEKIKYKICKEYKISLMLNSDILANITNPTKRIKELLKTKPVRSGSGVSVVAVMTKPCECPHGKCIMCPQGKDAPQSYTGKEPAAMRAISVDYDPKKQVMNRIKQLEDTGHPTDKIDVIVMGGTFTSMPEKYTKDFIKKVFNGMNGFDSQTLEEAQLSNENSTHRCIGLTIETRPDYCFEKQIEYILKLGATRVELGIQSAYNDVLKKIERGHTVEDTIKSTQLLKDSAYKINYHIMTGLPGSNPEKDFESFKQVFTNSDFKPDMIKIYPTMVIKGTKLYDMWKKGEYKEYSEEELIELLTKIKEIVPRWIRIMRIQRDIPLTQSEAGILKGNIRELLAKRIKCECIRCREIGRKNIKTINPKLLVEEYEASGSKEYFISIEDEDSDALIGFTRLRIPFQPFMPQITNKTGLIREIHVYGTEVEIGEKGDIQHRGFGKQLLKKAEEIAKEKGMDKMVVISGVGARNYFRKLNYQLDGNYMSKLL